MGVVCKDPVVINLYGFGSNVTNEASMITLTGGLACQHNNNTNRTLGLVMGFGR